MATNTYVALDKQTVGTAVASITFNSINQGYTDLVIIASQIATTTGNTIKMTFNGDTTSGLYSKTYLGAFTGGTTYGSTRFTGYNYIANDWQVGAADTTAPQTIKYDLMNYSNSTTYKTVLFRSNNVASAQSEVSAEVGLWRNTNAITSITLTSSATTFAVGSTFSLYGIKAEVGETSTKATGGVVTSDATYYYHTFLTSGNFVPNQSLTADYLVVGGGGSGGDNLGGGGGAGGYATSIGGSALSLTATSYAVLVGGGAASQQLTLAKGLNGTSSIFSSVTATGGGGGGTGPGGAGLNGLSGASGGGGAATGGTGGSSTGGGNAGGSGGGSGSTAAAGGGGGAGAAGGSSAGGTGGAGGVGLANSINGTSTYYAGGGGGGANSSATGGAGGNGGGGASSNVSGTDGTANTGGGGGGCGQYGNRSGAGGSGLVIVRYAK